MGPIGCRLAGGDSRRIKIRIKIKIKIKSKITIKKMIKSKITIKIRTGGEGSGWVGGFIVVAG
jgi:hypothetical protein